MRNHNVELPLGILSACAIAETALGYAHSADARGWWPIGLAVTLLLYAIYSLVFGSIAGERVLPTAYIVGLNGALAAVRLMVSYLFYTLPIDWGAVNTGTAQLNFMQFVVRSDWTFYLSPTPLLVAHYAAVQAGWIGVKRQTRSSAK